MEVAVRHEEEVVDRFLAELRKVPVATSLTGALILEAEDTVGDEQCFHLRHTTSLGKEILPLLPEFTLQFEPLVL